jgi:hypothetical protein
MAIRVCPLCQAEFLETRSVCTHCDVTLIAIDDDTDPRQLDPDDQVVYDLSSWPLDATSEAAQVLAESGIPHVWEGDEVIMPLVHEAAADRLLEVIEEQFGLVAADADGEEAPADATPGSETEYDLALWPAHQRMDLVGRLVELGVPHRWEGDLLVVPTSLERSVDGVLDEFEGTERGDDTGDLDADLDDEDDAAELDPAEALSALFLAAERMRRKRADLDSYGALLECLELSSPDRAPYGVDGRLWARALELGERLADAVAEDTDEVPTLAGELFDLVRPFV